VLPSGPTARYIAMVSCESWEYQHMFFFNIDAVVCENNDQFQGWELNIWQFIVIVEIKYFLNLNEYYCSIVLSSAHQHSNDSNNSTMRVHNTTTLFILCKIMFRTWAPLTVYNLQSIVTTRPFSLPCYLQGSENGRVVTIELNYGNSIFIAIKFI
jgi:hypothetical protein